MNRFIWYDAFNLLSKLTVLRFWNGVQLFSSFYLSRILRKSIHWGNPISVSIEPTTACNLGCPECPSGLKQFTRKTGNLKLNESKQIIDQFGKRLAYINFYFQGEPYINPDFLKMVQYASSKNIYTATSTNAHFLTEENSKKTIESGLDRIIISIDGATQESYAKYRIDGELEKVVTGTRNLVQWKQKLKSKTPHIILQSIIMKQNEHEKQQIQKLAKELGVNQVKFKTVQIYGEKDKNDLIPKNQRHSRYKKPGKLNNKLMNHCWRMWSGNVVTWDGKIVPCCFDKDANYQLGNLQQNKLSNIWNGKEYSDFRNRVLTQRKQIDICQNCSEGTKIWI